MGIVEQSPTFRYPKDIVFGCLIMPQRGLTPLTRATLAFMITCLEDSIYDRSSLRRIQHYKRRHQPIRLHERWNAQFIEPSHCRSQNRSQFCSLTFLSAITRLTGTRNKVENQDFLCNPWSGEGFQFLMYRVSRHEVLPIVVIGKVHDAGEVEA